MREVTFEQVFCRNHSESVCARCRAHVISRSFFCHLVSMTAKAVVGALTGSQALIADAVHSFTDLLAFGVNYAGSRSRPGLELLQSALIGAIMFLSGMWIICDNIEILITSVPVHPGLLGLAVAAAAVLMNIYLYKISVCVSKSKPGDSSVKMCVIQNKTNVFAGSAALIGITLADLGLVVFDPAFAILIGIFQFKGAFEIFRDGLSRSGAGAVIARQRITILVGFLSFCIIVFFGSDIQKTLGRRSVILIPSQTAAIDGPASALLGRAEYFYIMDRKNRASEVIPNANRHIPGDVSDDFLRLIDANGVGVVLAGKIGQEMFMDLNAARVQMFYFATPPTSPLTVTGAYRLYKDKQLVQARSANVEQGYGRTRVRWLASW
ncbi:MAG: cation transporter [Candidatus Omnitrophica bacterium]|nr:cation transporter [Candidatus Omnitrophota bacterium]